MDAVDDDDARNVVGEFKLMDQVMDGLFSVEGHEVRKPLGTLGKKVSEVSNSRISAFMIFLYPKRIGYVQFRLPVPKRGREHEASYPGPNAPDLSNSATAA